MIRNFTSHDKTECTNRQQTAQMIHGKNKTTCTSSDSTLKTHYNKSQFIQVITHELRHNLRIIRMIQRNRMFSEKRK